MKHIWWALPLAFGLAACSKVDNNSRSEATSDSVAGTAAESAPGIDPAVAPGVAFNYAYGYTLPERQIATAQEGHAALCGRLGVLHCRVTRLQFDKASGGQVDADMTFLLDPNFALGFARDATALVDKLDGKLATSRVVGEDVGKTIVTGDRSADAIRSELAGIEAQIRIPGLSKNVRGKLVTRSIELRAQLRTLDTERAGKVESLATTPVRFDYQAAPAGIGDMWDKALDSGYGSLNGLAGLFAWLVGAFGPLAAVAGGIWWAVRRWRSRAMIDTLT